MAHYWNPLTTSRLSRRRALTAGGSLAVSAAFLAACGGGESKSKPRRGVQPRLHAQGHNEVG